MKRTPHSSDEYPPRLRFPVALDMSADFWAGYVSGAAGILIGNPLDLVKTRLQAGTAASAESATVTAATGPASASAAIPPWSFKQHFDRAGTLVKGENTNPPSTFYCIFKILIGKC